MNVTLEVPRADFERLFRDQFDRLAQQLAERDDEPPKKEWLTNREAMYFLGVSRATMQRYRRDGRILYSKIGSGSLRYRRADLVAFLEAHIRLPSGEVAT